MSGRKLSALAVGLLAIVAACGGIRPLDPSLGARVITQEPPNDTYGLTVSNDVITATAPGDNTGNNIRVVFWRNADAASTNQESCMTWNAPDQVQQPGIALRAHDFNGGTRVISITKNVWLGGYWIFNVHVMDTTNPDVPLLWIAGRDLWGLRNGPEPTDLKPYPWRGCGRVVGTTVSLKVWPTAEAEPAWDDPNYGYSVTLPDGWDAPGEPGAYIGHLFPGGSATFSELVVTDLGGISTSSAAALGLEPTTEPLAPTHIPLGP